MEFVPGLCGTDFYGQLGVDGYDSYKEHFGERICHSNFYGNACDF